MSKIDILPSPFPFQENNDSQQSESFCDDPESDHTSDGRLLNVAGELINIAFPDEDSCESKEEDLSLIIADKITDVSLFPRMKIVKDKPIVKLYVVDDRKVRVGKREIELLGDQVLSFNALLLLRDRERSIDEISDLRPPSDASEPVHRLIYTDTITRMFNKLNDAAGSIIFRKTGRNIYTKYVVNPNLVVVDTRDPSTRPRSSDNGAPRKARLKSLDGISFDTVTDPSGPPPINEEDVLYVKLLKLYGDHPKVKRAEQQLQIRQATIDPESILERYYQEANQYQLLTPDDERRLFAVLGKGIALLEKGETPTPEEENILIEAAIAHRTIHLSNLRFAINRAKKYLGNNIEPLDLIQEANQGLFHAISRFDVDRGFKFSTYAFNRIRERIGRVVSDHSRTIRLPAHGHERWSSMQNHASELELELGRAATNEEIAKSTGFKITEVEDLLQMGSMQIRSINEQISDSPGGDELSTIIPDESSLDGFKAVEDAHNPEIISTLFKEADLTSLESAVLSMRYRVHIPALSGTRVDVTFGQSTKSLRSIPYDKLFDQVLEIDTVSLEFTGNLLGVHGDTVRKIQNRAFDKLSTYLSEHSLIYDGSV